MRPSRIKAKLRRGEPVLVTTIHAIDPSFHEMASLMGFDGLWLDLEHHPVSLETAAGLMRAARVGTADALVRPAKGEFMRLGRVLEAGAQGIMYPRCSDAAEAREVVQWAKFAPLGRRGVDSGNADTPYCLMPLDEYVREANEQTFIVVQLEDPGAVANAREIAEVEGVDVLFFGPGDYSVLTGVPGQFQHPTIEEAIRTVAAAARAAGKHWGIPVGSPERAKQMLDLGARLLAYGADIIWVQQGLEETRRRFAPLGLTFDGPF
jgi:4-hydroxy-2-oxoheptanedioate aldolase